MTSGPLPDAPASTGRPGAGLATLSLGAHAAFFLLVLTSATRFVVNHGSDGPVLAVVLLSVVLTLGYTALVVAGHRPPDGVQGVALLALILVWGVLVVVAPSFAWCAFPLYFLCRSHARPPWAYGLVAVVAALTSVALFRLSGWSDWAALVGPGCVALLLTLVYDTIERGAVARVRLLEEVAESRDRAAQAEHEAAVSAERARLAREIHDTITQDLASTLLVLEAADHTWDRPGSTARADVRRAIWTVRDGLAQTRNLVHDLATPRLAPSSFHAGMLAALQSQVAGATMTVTGTPVEVPPDVSHAALRITRSAAANVRQHAQASRVGLTLTYLPDEILVDIFDDGCGFDAAAVDAPSARGGYGLRAMRQRATQLAGTLTVETGVGEGTVVAARLPLPVERGQG